MPSFHDAAADAAEAREVLRVLAPFDGGDPFVHRPPAERQGLSL